MTISNTSIDTIITKLDTIITKLAKLDIIPDPALRLDFKLDLLDRHAANHPELADQLCELADNLLSNPF